jgi:hypothetical protein
MWVLKNKQQIIKKEEDKEKGGKRNGNKWNIRKDSN